MRIYQKLLLVLLLFVTSLCHSQLTPGAALHFDGVNDYVEGTNTNLPQGNTARTIEAWINPSSYQAGAIFNWGPSNTSNERAGLLYISGRLYYVSQGNDLHGNISIPINTWTHVAATFDGTMLKLYVNGVLDVSAPKTFTTNGFSYRFGTASPPGGLYEYFHGKIDETRIWNKALTQCELQNNSSCEFGGPFSGLVGYYKFSNGAAANSNVGLISLIDESGKSANGTLYNFALGGTTSNWVTSEAPVNALCRPLRLRIYEVKRESFDCNDKTKSFVAVPTQALPGQRFQWSRNGVSLQGATSDTLSSITLNHGDTIRCVISGSNTCSAISSVSNVQVVDLPLAVYTFNGNGNWDISSNWLNDRMPPKVLPRCSDIEIDPVADGECILNVPVKIFEGSNIRIKAGKKFKVLNDLLIIDTLTTSATNYFPDTTTKGTGLQWSTAAQLSRVPFVEDIDSTDLPTFNRTAFSLPPKVLDIQMPDIGDQDTINSCVGWSVGYGVMSYLYKKLENNNSYMATDKVFSPSFIYNSLYKGDNKGVSLSEALEFVKENGCSKFSDMPYTLDLSVRPSVEAVNNAVNYKISNFEQKEFSRGMFGFAMFHSVDRNLIKFYLAKKFVLPFGCLIDGGFKSGNWFSYEERKGKKVFTTYINPLVDYFQDNFGSPHAMVLCGYDDEIRAFKVMNSWGTGKGDGGYFWIDYDFFDKFVDGGLVRQHEIYVVYPRKPQVTVTTTPAISCYGSPTTATTGGSFTVYSAAFSIEEIGVCYSTVPNPTIANVLVINKKVACSNTKSPFTVTLTKLTPVTKYYYRAYAKTSKGIVYGNEMEFTTPQLPSLSETVTDVEGNIYNTVQIGSQLWMRENLRTTTYKDGLPIPYYPKNVWDSLKQPSYLWPNDDVNNKVLYGALYNWYAVNTTKVCPAGWHVPNNADWETLANTLGGYAVAGGKLKEAGTTHWINLNVGDNCSGFTALPAGENVQGFGFTALFWSATSVDAQSAARFYLGGHMLNMDKGYRGKGSAVSVRCLKD